MHRLLLFISATLLIVPVSPAQTVTGALTGTVTDPTGAVVPNVRITAINDATNLAYTAVANESGV